LDEYIDIIEAIVPIAGEEFHVQVPGVNEEEIVQNAIKIHSISPERIVIKIPLNNEGAKAIKKLKRIDPTIRITATAILTVEQAIIANILGVNYIAPFISRAYEIGIDGLKLVSKISAIYNQHKSNIFILAASIRNSYQAVEALRRGAHGITMKYKLLSRFISNESIEELINLMNKYFRIQKL